MRFLEDDATDEDYFGSHQRLAGAVVDAITGDQPLKVVGLLGPWGSGKSTVVRLIGKALGSGHRVFTYDAWLHQSEPHRRSFLEQFMAFLAEEGLVDAAHWKESLDEISGRSAETTTSTTPHLSGGGKTLLLSLFGVALGSRFLGVDWAKITYQSHWTEPKAYVFVAGLVLTCAPVLIALGLRLQRGNGEDGRAEDDSLLSLIVNRQVTTQTSRVTRTPDPTSIEFQHLFRRILAAVEPSKVRFVLVIDNLDRLPEAEALDMWATIRSILPGPTSTSQPTVVLPLDASAMGTVVGGTDAADTRRRLRSLMDKTFDAVFHVNMPVASDWQAFLGAAIGRAFGEKISEEWGFEVVRIYTRRTKARVAPRDLVRQVNAIAALWLQWRDVPIPFPVVAYYAICRDELDEDLLGAIANPVFDLSDHPNWRRELAAIHFGVAPEHALQVLLGPTVEQAIETGDPERFRTLMKRKGVAQLVVGLLEGERVPLRTASNVAHLLRGQDDRPEWQERAWRLLRRIWLRAGMQQIFEKDSRAPGLLAGLLEHFEARNRADLITDLARRVSDWRRPAVMLVGQEPEETLTALIRTWLPHAQAMDGAPTIVLHEPATFLDVAAPLAEEGGPPDLVRPDQGGHALGRIVAHLLQSDDEERYLPGKVSLAMSQQPGSDILGTLFASAAKILQQNSANASRLDAGAHVMGLLRATHHPAAEWLAAFAADGRLAGVLNRAAMSRDQSGLERLLALLVLERAEIPLAPGQLWSDPIGGTSKNIAKVDAMIALYGGRSLPTLVHYGRIEVTRPLATGLLERMVDSEDVGRTEDAGTPIRLDDLERIIPEGRRADVERLLLRYDESRRQASAAPSRPQGPHAGEHRLPRD